MPYIDSAILNLTQWFCRKFQVLTGRTNVWIGVQLTNLSIVVYFVWAGAYFWNTDLVPRMAGGLFCAALLYGTDPDGVESADRVVRDQRVRTGCQRSDEPETSSRPPPAHVLSDAFSRAPLSRRVRPRQSARTSRPADLLVDRADDGGLVRAGLRSAAAMCGEGARVAPRLSAATAGAFAIHSR